MLKRTIIILSILLLLILTAHVGKLAGTVVDQATGKPLAGANIFGIFYNCPYIFLTVVVW